jgi:hypothetical protein
MVEKTDPKPPREATAIKIRVIIPAVIIFRLVALGIKDIDYPPLKRPMIKGNPE